MAVAEKKGDDTMKEDSSPNNKDEEGQNEDDNNEINEGRAGQVENEGAEVKEGSPTRDDDANGEERINNKEGENMNEIITVDNKRDNGREDDTSPHDEDKGSCNRDNSNEGDGGKIEQGKNEGTRENTENDKGGKAEGADVMEDNLNVVGEKVSETAAARNHEGKAMSREKTGKHKKGVETHEESGIITRGG